MKLGENATAREEDVEAEASNYSQRDDVSAVCTRRKFMGEATLAAGLAAWSGSPVGSRLDAAVRRSAAFEPQLESMRTAEAYEVRVGAARQQCKALHGGHSTNGDEDRYPNRIGNFTKGLPHNQLGEVDRAAYNSLIDALTGSDPSRYEKIILGGDRRLTNPQAGTAFEMRGPDSHVVAIPPAPTFCSAEEAAEIAENYWMALTRDIAFDKYDTDPLILRAAEDLSRFSDFRGPRAQNRVTPQCIFRGTAPGTSTGPYLSQFLLIDARYGTEHLNRKLRTVVPGLDYVTGYDEWLSIQNGNSPWPDQYDATPRYIRNGRDLGQWVHYDLLFQAFLDALLVLFQFGAQRTSHDPYIRSRTQQGFVTFGSVHIASLVGAVCQPALKATWFQKWFVHRRLRPEEYAGRIHNHATARAEYPIHPDIFRSEALEMVFARNGTYMLPQAYPEGSPTHPAYSAGHATTAGACTTILKAFFEESFVIRRPLVASSDGLSTVAYEGSELTVGGELNKLAYNIAMGRNMAGVHWRSDAEESLKLGERMAINYLAEERNCLREAFDGFSFTKFDGTRIGI
jgi:hypothetical protein